MKLVREHINEKFKEDSDPISDLGIGLLSNIKKEYEHISRISLYERGDYLFHNGNWMGASMCVQDILRRLLKKEYTSLKNFNKTIQAIFKEKIRSHSLTPIGIKAVTDYFKRKFDIDLKDN